MLGESLAAVRRSRPFSWLVWTVVAVLGAFALPETRSIVKSR